MTTVQHHNPTGLPSNSAYSQAVSVIGPHRTIYVGGQNAVDDQGQIVGPGDLGLQTERILQNLQIVLNSAGAGLEHVVKWTIYVLQGQPIGLGFAAFQRAWGNRPTPPAISVLYVAGFARPEFLAELEAVAIVPIAHEEAAS